MVAITILVVAVAAPLTLAAQSLFAAFYAKDQTTAFYLAQEAIEMVRNQRDDNMLRFLNGDATVQWLDNIPVGQAFFADAPNDTMNVCSASCLDSRLRYNGTFYNYQNGDASRFSRSVLVEQNPTLPNEAVVSVTVAWQTGSFRPREFTLRTRMYNWVPNQE